MIYSYDKAAEMPVMDLYNTQMMLAEVAAAKDMYEKAAKQIEDFREKYGTFSSPISAQQAWYDKNFNVSKFVGDIYARGGDPLRNQADRAELYRYINSRPYAKFAQKKKWAENADAYRKAAGVLAAKGLYDPAFDQWYLSQINPESEGKIENWGEDQPFNLMSPMEFSNLHDMVHPTFQSIKAHKLTKEELESKPGWEGKYDPNNDYTGVVESDMRRAMEQYMPGVRNNPLFQYHRELARRDLIREGNSNPSAEQIDQRFINNAITADAGIMTPLDIEPNKWAMAEFEHRSRMAAAVAGRSVTVNNYGDTYNTQDDLYEMSLKNAIGLDPKHPNPTDKQGNPVTMQMYSNNNPEFYKAYKEYLAPYSIQKGEDGKYTLTGKDVVKAGSIIKALTFQKGSQLADLPSRMGEKEITKLGSDGASVTGRHYYPVQIGFELLTEYELENKLREGAWGKGFPSIRNGNEGRNIIMDNIKTAYYTPATNKNYGLVGGLVDGEWSIWEPIYVKASDNGKERLFYRRFDYRGVPNTGAPEDWLSSGISTTYNNKYSFAAQASSGSVDKSLGVKPTERVSTSVDTPYPFD